MLVVCSLLIKPPMAKLWPSYNWTVVAARRVVISGRMAPPAKPCAEMPMPWRDTSDTSGATLSLMRPPASTVGVKCRPTPNSFSSSVTLLLSCATGTKILPPARKLPSWPLIAITVGSASMRTRPSCFCACRLNWLPLLLTRPSPLVSVPVRKFDSSVVVQLPLLACKVALASSWSSSVFDTSDFHFQHHLLRRADGQQVDDAAAAAARPA